MVPSGSLSVTLSMLCYSSVFAAFAAPVLSVFGGFYSKGDFVFEF
jgi:hypothetical protein